MTVKCTGSQYKQFFDDEAYWPEDVYCEYEQETLNGVAVDENGIDLTKERYYAGLDLMMIMAAVVELTEPSK